MRPAALAVLLAACGPADPALQAWHGPVRVTAAARADGGCDATPQEVAPESPWLFVAVARGAPDLLSLYWCDGPEECPTLPWSTVALDRLTPKAVSGVWGQVGLVGDSLCSVRWDGVDGERDGDEVRLTVRGYLRPDLQVTAPEECDALLADLIDDVCDTVWTLEGTAGE